MLVRNRHHGRRQQRRRGIVLVLVLAMMGLLAVIGVTFATLSAQSKINARNFYQSVIQPQDDELMDFALQQLITDTGDVRSAIRGHSLARDMYGNDGSNNGYLTTLPYNGGSMYFNPNKITQVAATPVPYWDVQTNIPSNAPAMFGYNFTRWIIRMTYTGPTTPGSQAANSTLYPRAVSQTFEVIIDDNGSGGTTYGGQGYRAFRIGLIDPASISQNTYSYPNLGSSYYPMPNAQTVLNNPSLGFTTPPPVPNPSNPTAPTIPTFPGWQTSGTTNSYNLSYMPTQQAFQQLLSNQSTSNGNYATMANYPFTLDGRWLHAFNGVGLSTSSTPSFPLNWSTSAGTSYNIPNYSVPLSTWGNFRYNGVNPNKVGMDEDYDACDLENWFLAIQSADGQVMIPSFHRPSVVRYQDPGNLLDWDPSPTGFRNHYFQDSASRILRPVAADGHDAVTFPNLIPDPTTGKITYDVDNDGDGVTDSVWVDLGYPARRDARGNLYKPLFAFMVIGLNGRIPLNTAGNLAGGGATHSQHLGNSISEIDPTYGLQNGFTLPLMSGPSTFLPPGDVDPFNQLGSTANNVVFNGPTGSYFSYNTQVDNAINAVQGSNNYQAYQSVDVRLTQLRNLLAGTRPQTNPFLPNSANNGELNIVYGSWAGHNNAGVAYTLPNGVADSPDVPLTSSSVQVGNNTLTLPLVQRLTAPVGGRWGEASAIAGVGFPNPNGNGPLNMVQPNYVNMPRAGYSFDVADMLLAAATGYGYDANGNPVLPRDTADDNYNAFDVWPPRMTGEIGDTDLYDSAGALVLPVERMRRFVTPIDINGTGRVNTWGILGGGRSDYGPDNLGRVQFSSYFRPAGSPGVINITTPFPSAASPNTPVATSTEYPYGAITPGPGGAYASWYDGMPLVWTATTTTAPTNYIPDVTNNPLHGFELFRLPNQYQYAGVTTPASTLNASPPNPATLGGMPIDEGQSSANANFPATLPTYDPTVNSKGTQHDGVNEADEMNLYSLNPLLDSPFGPADLEWLYRQQDVDGSTLTSRLSQLAPISFTNTIDGQRRRRLYALQSWETNSFAWTNDNPGGNFANNARFTPLVNGGTTTLGVQTPALAHRDRKINLNYPLPVSNDCNEPIRQRWISDTYRLLKSVLPPTAVDSPEELAQLSQYVINIVDFRDPDATMTHWVNPDVWLIPGTVPASGSATPYTITVGSTTQTYTTPPSLVLAGSTVVPGSYVPLDQFGVEYNPVAINEVLAYGFQSRSNAANSSAQYTNRVFVELVNTLTAAYNPLFDATTPADPQNYYGYGTTYTNGNSSNNPQPPYQNTNGSALANYPLQAQASTLDLGGFSYLQNDPYGGGCWDLVFTLDNPMSRPDPFRGDLVYNTSAVTYYSLVPLNRDALTASAGGAGGTNPTAPNGGDATLIPVSPAANNVIGASITGIGNIFYPPTTGQPTPPINYFYVVGSPPSASSGASLEYPNPIGTPTGSGNNYPCVSQYFTTSYDPMGSVVSTGPPGFMWRQGILPGVQYNNGTYIPPVNYSWELPVFNATSTPTTSGTASTTPPLNVGGATYYWVCLRRPANPFAPVSATNPMVVVDSMRFPYIDGTANAGLAWNYVNGTSGPVAVLPPSGNGAATANTIFSAQRLQPYRGGHAVPMPNAPGISASAGAAGPVVTMLPPDPRYGYSEQIASPSNYTCGVSTVTGGVYGTYGLANTTTSPQPYASTGYIYHSLGYYNDSAENWDYFVFNDRDFSSVAELLLVPGCPPGLFTKQFVEFSASQMNAANIFSRVTPTYIPQFPGPFASNTPPTLNTPIGTSGSSIPPTVVPAPFTTATVPFLDVTVATSATAVGSSSTGLPTPTSVPNFSSSTSTTGGGGGPGGGGNTTGITYPYAQPLATNNTPVQPHAFPYLVDRFFYTGASTFYYPPNGTLMDPGSANSALTPVVGGPGGDGWFKMLEFFEVPSQAMGATGTVAQGVNFDWARQDFKPGLMNLNLIIDEEAFYAIFGRNNNQNSRSYNQALLNSIQLPLLATYHPNTGQLTLPYGMPLSTQAGNNGAPPIPMGGPPVPLVVSAIQPTGAPNYAYPVTDQTQLGQHGYLANDPIIEQLTVAANNTNPLPYPGGLVGNRIKAAFAQFLSARHGGSGYMFGYGTGNTGQNSAIATPGISSYSAALPAERPFRSLSYPDINFTVMRPAALPPSTVSNPAMLADPTNTYAPSIYTAQSLYVTQTPYAPTMSPPLPYATPPYFSPNGTGATGVTPYFYSPYTTSNTTNFETVNGPVPIVYTGDPGVRNPFFNQGYASSGLVLPSVATAISVPYSTYSPSVPLTTTTPNFNVLAGIPLPLNVAFPTGSATSPVATDSVMMPPPIPPARLFQVPDDYGHGLIRNLNYMGLWDNGGQPAGTVPPAVSNASDSGDPWINNTIANQLLSPFLTSGLAYPPTYSVTNLASLYTLNQAFMSLIWAGGQFFSSATSSTPPYLTSTGVLPPASISYPPYTPPYLNVNIQNTPAHLSYANGYMSNGITPGGPVTTPYFGGSTAGTNTDDRQHPYWRTELLQKAMNLTTVRTHQYAVWITVGFFEIRRQGDISMLAQGAIQLAFDIMGPEVGALNGQNVRFRGFFIVDRLQLTGFNYNDVGGFRRAVVYRRMIQ